MAAVLLLSSSAAMAQSEKISSEKVSKPRELSAAPSGTTSRLGGGFSENFDATANGALPDGWTQFEAGTGALPPAETAEVWAVLPYSAKDPTLGKAAGVFYEDVASGEATDYLVTPQITIGSADELRADIFELYAPDYGSTYEIRLSTTTNTTAAAFSVVLASYTEDTLPTLTEGALGARFDLSAYAGQSVYIAFVFTNDDGDAFVVDNVSVQPAPVSPAITATPAAIDFGSVDVGTTSATQTVTVTNSGGGTLTLSGITLTGTDASLFTLNTTGTSLSLGAGQSTTFTVSYSPTAIMSATASVSIASDVSGSPTVIALTGNGIVPPPNDDFADATPIAAPGTVTGSNVSASLEEGEVVPSCNPFQDASVWWSYTPTADGTISVDLSASDVDDFDPLLTIYGPDGTTELGCDDDGGAGFTSALFNIPVTAGQTVYIRVAGYTDLDDVTSTGPISFELTVGGALVTSTIPSGDTTGDTTFGRPSSVGTGASGSCTLSGTATAVNYDALPFTVATAGFFSITTNTSTAGYDGYVLLYRGTFDPADPCLNLVALNDDGVVGVANDSQIGAMLEAGGYTLVITGFNNLDFGAYDGTIAGLTGIVFGTAGETAPGESRTSLTAGPNPVRGAARVRLDVETAQDVAVTVYDVTGRQVMTLFDGAVAAGQTLTLGLDASALPAGVYVVQATGASVRLTQRVTVVR